MELMRDRIMIGREVVSLGMFKKSFKDRFKITKYSWKNIRIISNDIDTDSDIS